MSSVAKIFGTSFDPHPRRKMFLRWQCHIRQMTMRQDQGRPHDAMVPELTLLGEEKPMGHIITVMCKEPGSSITPEMMHMVRQTNDPAQRREKALQLFSETHYQKPDSFSDILTSTFPVGSEGAAKIRAANRCTLKFEAYSQEFVLDCKVWKLAKHNPLFEATWWHNKLFNSELLPDVEVLGFEPDWEKSVANPDVPGL
jgi:hypothetical protein